MVRYHRKFILMLAVFAMSIGGSSVARAACTLFNVQSVTGTTVNTGAYVSGAGSSTAVSLTFRFLKFGTGGTCVGRVAFDGALAVPQMTNGTSTLNYSIPAYYTGGTPGSTLNFSFANPPGGIFGIAIVTVTVGTTLTVPAGQTGQTNGLHGDNTIVVRAFNGTSNTPLAGVAPNLLVSATVANPSSCTIGGSANGGTQSLDFSNGTTITTGQQFATFGTVTCNASATISLTSSGGAAKNAAPASGSYTNFFNYIATTTVNGGTATLNTATNPATTGPETANGSITAVSTTNAPLSIGVQPQLPGIPLVAGSYADVLTVTITPN